jgi:antitoxin YefM
MAEVTTAELRSHLSDILNRVAYGKERITITRHGKTLAVIAPPIEMYVEALLAQRPAVEPALVRETMGKYTHLHLTSDEIARAKQEEIEREG